MGSTTQRSFKKNNVISASEIGQYHFCPMAWYLQRCGYKPKSESLDIGKKKHEELGRIMYYTQKNMIKSKIFAFVGYFLLIVAVIFLFFEVVI
jgi:CRISPR/Cas system-associated exonuclease Cas4 (RecB family)